MSGSGEFLILCFCIFGIIGFGIAADWLYRYLAYLESTEDDKDDE